LCGAGVARRRPEVGRSVLFHRQGPHPAVAAVLGHHGSVGACQDTAHHTARVASTARVLYPFHRGGQVLEIFGSVAGTRDLVYVRLASGATRGFPVWMFDEAVCASVRCAEQATIDCVALLGVARLLDAQQGKLRSAGHEAPSQPPIPSPHLRLTRQTFLLLDQNDQPHLQMPMATSGKCIILLSQLLQATGTGKCPQGGTADEQ
jgi:hypothetical protein